MGWNPLPSGEVKAVMPVKTGIHVRVRYKAEENLDSGLRRNDKL